MDDTTRKDIVSSHGRINDFSEEIRGKEKQISWSLSAKGTIAFHGLETESMPSGLAALLPTS